MTAPANFRDRCFKLMEWVVGYNKEKAKEEHFQAADPDDLGLDVPAGDGEREAGLCRWNL